jgi:RNA polymerase sigma-70 factor (ECF subfamily)
MIASITFSGSGSVATKPAIKTAGVALARRVAAAGNPDKLSTSRKEALFDAELVRRFNGGDESAFVEIIDRYQEKMFSVALWLLRNRADAEEVAQDTFIRAHRALSRFRGESALATWLHRITLNLSRNRYWYLFRRRYHTTQSLDSALSEENQATLASVVASDAPGPQEEAQTIEFTRLVAVCMERLGPGRRDMLTRRNLMNCSYDEIARSLGISIGTVKSRIARAREALRAQLVSVCPEFSAGASPTQWLYPARASNRLELGRK